MEKIPHTLIQEKVASRFGADIVSIVEEPLYKVLEITVDSGKIIELLKFLYDDKELQFQFLTSLFGVHWPERKGEEMGLVYLLHNLWKNTRIRIKTTCPSAILKLTPPPLCLKPPTGWSAKPMISSG